MNISAQSKEIIRNLLKIIEDNESVIQKYGYWGDDDQDTIEAADAFIKWGNKANTMKQNRGDYDVKNRTW